MATNLIDDGAVYYLNGVEVEKEDGNVRLTFWEKVWTYQQKERRIEVTRCLRSWETG